MKVRIGRINLYLRNVSPAMAKDAADLLGPELARAFVSSEDRAKAVPARTTNGEAASGRAEQDAGHLRIGTGLDAHALATGIAGRIAARTSKG